MKIVFPLLVLVAGCWIDRQVEDRTTAPRLPASGLEVVADLDYPPGNIGVSRSGRVFFTFHPDGAPPTQLHELVGGRAVPWPDAEIQHVRDDEPGFDSVLSVRIDAQDRLWALDFARYGRGQPRLWGFDVESGRLVHQYDFPSEVAGLFSMLNDFQVDATGERIYIAEASPIIQRPALIVYHIPSRTSRRVLHRHPSVQAGDYLIHTPERTMVAFGIYPLRIGVDSIGLERSGEWLYYGPVTGDRLFRIRTRDLNDPSIDPAERVEDAGPKPVSDGLTTDDQGRVYVTDPEHGAVLAREPDRSLVTLVKDPRLRWPDGLSFGPDGWLYVTCSALQHVLFVRAAHVRAHAPYQIYRFRPGGTAAPGQ
jgi:sugar lactone lactonase YvrE